MTASGLVVAAPRSGSGKTTITLGLLAAFTLHRFAYLLIGKSWVIRQGEISIQRIALDGRPSAQTIRGSDIEAIDLGRSQSEEGTSFTIKIKLRNGKTLRSPTSHDEEQARAVHAEIIRRLGLLERPGDPAGALKNPARSTL